MPCYTPLQAYRAPGGQISFNPTKGWSDRPIQFSCGQCIGCRAQRTADWALRLVHESQMHRTNAFVTLTYDNAYLPPDGGLRLRDWQLFAKRLRKDAGPFRFYHCGEYGPNTRRPHYHACIFGLDFNSDRVLFKEGKLGHTYTSKRLTELWQLGHATHGALTYESAAYVARYCMKKITGDQAAEEYGDLRPPYSTMSLKPGLGKTWLERFMDDVYPSDEVVHKGRKHRPPKFYDNQLPEDDLKDIKNKRIQRELKRAEHSTPRRLRDREHIARERMKSMARDKN